MGTVRENETGSTLGDHAVVLGAGIGGLLASRVLSDYYRRVTVIERDILPDHPTPRRGVPQGKHVHGLLPRGKSILEDLFPGFRVEMAATGAVECDALQQVRFSLAGHELNRSHTGYTALQASRPHLEHHIRRRITALPNVEIRDGCAAIELMHDRSARRVSGVRIGDRRTGGDTETLPAELTVASMGRGSTVTTWLDQLGYELPSEQGTPIDIVYTSVYVRLRPDALVEDKSITVGVRQLPPRALAMFAVEGDCRILTLIGFGGHRPPRDPADFADFVAQFAPPDVAAAICDAEFLTEPATFRYKANLRRRYDQVTDSPAGLVVSGDTLCSFNPVYGQGMTVAAIQMQVLRDCLARGGGDLARRFYRAVQPEIDNAWQLTVVADSAMPHVTAETTTARIAALALDPVLAAAERDGAVATALFQVIGLVDSPYALLAPNIATRIGISNTKAVAATATRRVLSTVRQPSSLVPRSLGA